MNFRQVGDLFQHVKRSGGKCLDNGDILEAWLAKNPEADACMARRLVGARGVWPSIDGNPPVYRANPYYNARLHEVRMPNDDLLEDLI